jgi:hypothetical protein
VVDGAKGGGQPQTLDFRFRRNAVKPGARAIGSTNSVGDDENDVIAMAWVIRQGSMAISIGSCPLVFVARSVATPDALVTEIRKLAGLQSL